VTRFKIEWDDKPASTEQTEAGPSSAGETSARDEDENSMDQLNDSDSNPPLLVDSVGSGDLFGRDRLSADSTSSLMEPPVDLMPQGISGSNDSMSSPMEVI
jgi:hypothetical protein